MPSLIHLLENNTYFTLFICIQSSLYFFIESALYFTLFTIVMAYFWNNRTKRKECEYIIAMAPFAAPAAKTSTNVSSGGVPRVLLICIVVFVAG